MTPDMQEFAIQCATEAIATKFTEQVCFYLSNLEYLFDNIPSSSLSSSPTITSYRLFPSTFVKGNCWFDKTNI